MTSTYFILAATDHLGVINGDLVVTSPGRSSYPVARYAEKNPYQDTGVPDGWQKMLLLDYDDFTMVIGKYQRWNVPKR